MAKMNKKMIAICSAAVGSLYLTGLTLTEPTLANQNKSAAIIQQSSGASSSGQTAAAPSSNNENQKQSQPRHRHHRDGGFSDHHDHSGQPTQNNTNKNSGNSGQQTQNSSNSGQTQDNSNSSSATAKTGSYKDGTYTGMSSNRIGGVQVAVTIKSKKIASVQITDCTTSYSESNIAGLPDQVVARQSANVDLVSGATLSSEDFQGAVQQALQQAQS